MGAKNSKWIWVGVVVIISFTLLMMVLFAVWMEPWTTLTMATLTLLVIVMVVVFAKVNKDKREGFPSQDEMTRSLSMRAGYYSYYVSLYVILGMAILLLTLEDDAIELSISELLFIVVALMGSFNIIFNIYYKNKGKRFVE
jgi:Ca2+/Na+ antiporter